MTLLACVHSDGGPILLIAAELAPRWRGTSPAVDDSAAREGANTTDYDRACDAVEGVFEVAETFAGTLPVGQGRALILDGEASTAAVAWRGGLLVVRTPPFEREEELVRAVEPLERARWTATEHRLELATGRAFVFDTAYEGAPTSDRIEAQGGVLDIQATPGRYDVLHASLPHPLGGTMPLLWLAPIP